MTPATITRRTGLNRTVLLRPGAPWHERPAGRVLGAIGLSRTVEDAAAAAGVDIGRAPLVALDRALAAGQGWAEAVAQRWIDAFLHLLRTLRTPTRADREARAEWGAEDWATWAAVRRVVVCGGVVAGELGARLGRDPRLEQAGATVAKDPSRTPLLGLASALDGEGLALDLGHTTLKAARVQDGRLVQAGRTPVPWRAFDTSTWPAPETLLDLVVQTARSAVRERPGSVERHRLRPDEPLAVAVAIANYVVDGTLDQDQTYGTLVRPGTDPRDLLAQALTHGLRRPCVVTHLVNDGTAAALGVEAATVGATPAAVISVGTSLGVGFTGA